MGIDKPIEETEVKQPRPRQRYTQEYKLKILQEYDSAMRVISIIIKFIYY